MLKRAFSTRGHHHGGGVGANNNQKRENSIKTRFFSLRKTLRISDKKHDDDDDQKPLAAFFTSLRRRLSVKKRSEVSGSYVPPDLIGRIRIIHEHEKHQPDVVVRKSSKSENAQARVETLTYLHSRYTQIASAPLVL